MSRIWQALGSGLRRFLAHLRLPLWLYLANVALALTPALLLSAALRESLDHSQAADDLAAGFSDEWYREFQVDADGFAATFTPAVTGLGAVLDGLDAFVTGDLWRQFAPVVALGILLLLLWTFVTGGAVHLYRTPGASRQQFWAACGRCFGPLLRLLFFAGLFYLLAYKLMLPWVDRAIQTVNRQTVDERIAFAWVLAKYLLVLAYVFLVNLVFDYAKIICVTDDKGAFSAARDAVKFVCRRPLDTIGLYLSLGLIGVGLIALYALAAPGALQADYLGLIWAFAVGQAFILGRIGLRLYGLAAQSQLYRGEKVGSSA